MLSVSEYNPHLQTGKLRPLMLCLTEVTQEEGCVTLGTRNLQSLHCSAVLEHL